MHDQPTLTTTTRTSCHSDELLALRLAVPMGAITAETHRAALEYVSPVPLFASGAAAADHGTAEIASPGPAAVRAVDKITRRRSDIT
nr:DUF6283 family protein [Nocardia panacis]